MAGMFRGNCATLLKVVPQTAIQFAVSGLRVSTATGCAKAGHPAFRVLAQQVPLWLFTVCHQVYDTIVEAMLASMAKMELAPGADKHQLSRWQHLTAGKEHTARVLVLACALTCGHVNQLQVDAKSRCAAGCAAGAAGTVVTYPFETLRCHMAGALTFTHS